MSFFHLTIVALVQGITEFLPVSSSGHLILVPILTGFDDQGLAIDVAVHVGTLGAVLVYFRADVARVLRGIGHIAAGRLGGDEARLALMLALATVPVVIAGLAISLAGVADALRSVRVVGWATLVFGLVLWWADRQGGFEKRAQGWSYRDALLMGLAQVVALIPGTSRSGITITAARWLGYERRDAARLAMLMSIPTIAASGVLLGAETALAWDTSTLRDGAFAAILSFAAALGTLHVMMLLMRTVSFTPYVIYRIALGVVLLAISYS